KNKKQSAKICLCCDKRNVLLKIIGQVAGIGYGLKLMCFAIIAMPSLKLWGRKFRKLTALSMIKPVFSGLLAVCVKSPEFAFLILDLSSLKNAAVSTAIS